jgi:hypothetical protein
MPDMRRSGNQSDSYGSTELRVPLALGSVECSDQGEAMNPTEKAKAEFAKRRAALVECKNCHCWNDKRETKQYGTDGKLYCFWCFGMIELE